MPFSVQIYCTAFVKCIAKYLIIVTETDFLISFFGYLLLVHRNATNNCITSCLSCNVVKVINP